MAVRKIAPLLSPAEVLDRILDKGIVIEAEIHVAVAGIEVVTISALVRVASFATWDRHVAASATRSRRSRVSAVVEAPDPGRVRLRCDAGCTLERRASTLVVRDGRLGPQRCVVTPRRRCAVSVV
jgi:hypothetical protein